MLKKLIISAFLLGVCSYSNAVVSVSGPALVNSSAGEAVSAVITISTDSNVANIRRIRVFGADAVSAQDCVGVMLANGSCNITISIDAAEALKAKSARVYVYPLVADRVTHTVKFEIDEGEADLGGGAIEMKVDRNVESGSLDLGPVDVSASDYSKRLYIRNLNRTKTKVLVPSLSGHAMFSIQNDNCSGRSLRYRQICTLDVVASSALAEAGVQSATVSIGAVGATSSEDIVVSGNFAAGGPAPAARTIGEVFVREGPSINSNPSSHTVMVLDANSHLGDPSSNPPQDAVFTYMTQNNYQGSGAQHLVVGSGSSCSNYNGNGNETRSECLQNACLWMEDTPSGGNGNCIGPADSKILDASFDSAWNPSQYDVSVDSGVTWISMATWLVDNMPDKEITTDLSNYQADSMGNPEGFYSWYQFDFSNGLERGSITFDSGSSNCRLDFADSFDFNINWSQVDVEYYDGSSYIVPLANAPECVQLKNLVEYMDSM